MTTHTWVEQGWHQWTCYSRQGNPIRPHPYTKSNKQLRRAAIRRGGLSGRRAHKMLIQSQLSALDVYIQVTLYRLSRLYLGTHTHTYVCMYVCIYTHIHTFINYWHLALFHLFHFFWITFLWSCMHVFCRFVCFQPSWFPKLLLYQTYKTDRQYIRTSNFPCLYQHCLLYFSILMCVKRSFPVVLIMCP